MTTGAYGVAQVTTGTVGAMWCPDCGKSWLEDITPAGRCPWEHEHGDAPKPLVFTPTITLGSEGMRNDHDIADALASVAEQLRESDESDSNRIDAVTIRDANGTTVGSWGVS